MESPVIDTGKIKFIQITVTGKGNGAFVSIGGLSCAIRDIWSP